MKKITKDKRGISPVIATVIIVAVTIAVAIAVAFWMSGLVNIFTRFEKLEITSAYATSSGTTYTITLNFKNTGSAAASISDVLVNGIPVSQMIGNVTSAKVNGIDFAVATPPAPVPCNVGNIGQLVLEAPIATPGKGTFVSGVSVEIRLHTAAGKDYPQVVTLP
jgi:flagellin-like protein